MTDLIKILPKLRFPEFENDGEWKVVRLGEIFKRITDKNKENNNNVLTISAQDGLVSQYDYFNKNVAANDVTGYYLIKTGDFAYNKSRSQGYPYGAIKPLKLYDKGVVSTLYICFRAKEKNSCIDFYEHYFETDLIHNEIGKIAQEGARNHGLLNISTEDFFEKISLYIPSLPEQQKIAAFLTSLDEQISAHTKKLEVLKAHKKGLMQQLFPANGEKTPKLRFPEFKNDGEWKEILLGKVANVYQGYGFPDAMQGKKTGKYPFYKVSDISNTVNKGLYKIDVAINYVDDDDLPLLNNAKPIPPRTIIFAKIGEAIRLNRRVITIKESLIDNNTAGVKAKNREIDDMFLFYIMIMIDLIKFAGGVVPAVKKTIIENIQIIIPEIPEQQKIASFLTSIDEMIQALDDKIRKLKTYKNGLMQQMFAVETPYYDVSTGIN